MYHYKRELLLVTPDAKLCVELTSLLVDQDWNVKFLESAHDVMSTYKFYEPSVIVLDEDACDRTDLDITSLCNSFGETSAVIPLVSNVTVESLLATMRTGATDVLLKPLNYEELLKAVERASLRSKIVRERSHYQQELEKTNHDLTASLNVLQQDQIAGRHVQESLLPPTPQKFHDYVIAHHIVPSLYLSGDSVTHSVMFDRYLLFYLIDVSGHGASSAFVTVLMRFMLNKILRRHMISGNSHNLATAPEGLAESFNRQLIHTNLDKHMTMFAGMIDMEENVLRYVTAAQMPEPIYVVDGVATVLPCKGKPIGIFEDATWNVREIDLPDEFSLTIASDGILETLSGTTIEEKELQLLNAVRDNCVSIEGICEQLGIYQMKDTPDDISLLHIVRSE